MALKWFFGWGNSQKLSELSNYAVTLAAVTIADRHNNSHRALHNTFIPH